jgi:putative oxidoreductase
MSANAGSASGAVCWDSKPGATHILEAWSPQVLSVFRIITALLLIEHGLMKLFHLPAAMPGLSDPLPPLLMVAGVIEVVGGMLVAVGLYASVAAFICSGEMAVAYLMIHAPQSFWPALSHGDSAILFCFVFFYLAIAGPGPWTLDAVIGAAELRDEARSRAANARLSPAQFSEYRRLLGKDWSEASSERARLAELLTLRNRVTEQEVDEQLVLIRREWGLSCPIPEKRETRSSSRLGVSSVTLSSPRAEQGLRALEATCANV